jgi:hypothetical protein
LFIDLVPTDSSFFSFCFCCAERAYIFFGFFPLSMAAPPARARADYDYLIKLLLIGDSGMALLSSCFLF